MYHISVITKKLTVNVYRSNAEDAMETAAAIIADHFGPMDGENVYGLLEDCRRKLYNDKAVTVRL
jgi:hypothetical protein